MKRLHLCQLSNFVFAPSRTDIVEIFRIEEKIARSDFFKTHVFSENEIAYCDKQKKPFVSRLKINGLNILHYRTYSEISLMSLFIHR